METIGIGQALVITVFSMTVVFVVLVGISFLIDLLRVVVEKGERKKIDTTSVESAVGAANTKSIERDTIEETNQDEELTNEELIAVISAAVAASMGLDLPDINVKSIKRVDNSWKNVARNEQVLKNI